MMKKVVTSLLLASIVVSARAVTLYPNAVLAGDGITLSSLQADGWNLVFNSPFSGSGVYQSDISSWQAAAGASGYVFVGETDANGNIILGATGGSEVLNLTNSMTLATAYASSNMFWYNNPMPNTQWYDTVGSMGFSKDQNVYLFEADTATSNPQYRLSWHTNFSGGGYRPEGAYKVVLVSQGGPSSVPDAASTLMLLGTGLVTMAGLRRRLQR